MPVLGRHCCASPRHCEKQECHLIMGKICFIEESTQKPYKQLSEVCRVQGIRIQKTIRWTTIKGSARSPKRKIGFRSELQKCFIARISSFPVSLKAQERCKFKSKAIEDTAQWKLWCSSQVFWPGKISIELSQIIYHQSVQAANTNKLKVNVHHCVLKKKISTICKQRSLSWIKHPFIIQLKAAGSPLRAQARASQRLWQVIKMPSCCVFIVWQTFT